jgi:FAD synthetase
MKVLVFGTFDGLHPGHMDLFRQAKDLGDQLHIVVARDETVLATKKRSPVNSEQARLQQVQQALPMAIVQLGNPGDKYAIVEAIRPDIIALGYDQKFFTEALESELLKRGLRPRIVRLKAFRPDQYKSSLLREMAT